MKTSGWRDTWGRRITEGEVFHYVKDPATGELNHVSSDGKETTIHGLLVGGRTQAPDADAAMAVEVPSGVVAGAVRGVQVIINSGRPILAY